jgi:hypothetical protein
MARENGLVLVEDLSMVDAQPSELVYTRLRVPGPGAALRGGAIERLAEQLTEVREAYVVIEGRGSARARSMITQAVAAAVAAAADESDDSGLEEDDEFEPLSGSLEDDEEDLDADDEDADDEDADDEDADDEDADDEDADDEDADEDDEDEGDAPRRRR